MMEPKKFFKNIRKFICCHGILLCFTLIGVLAGIWGIPVGFFAGITTEIILKRIREEKKCSLIIEQGFCTGEFPKEPFPGALYMSALIVYCLGDPSAAVCQISLFFKDYPADWSMFCRAASSAEVLNCDLMVECMASSISRHINSGSLNTIPLQKIFSLLGSAEFTWDEKSQGMKPSQYLANLLDYCYVNDDLLNAYHVLGLEPDATLQQLKIAHRKLATQYHPDHDEPSEDKIDLFMRIQNAYELILHRFF